MCACLAAACRWSLWRRTPGRCSPIHLVMEKHSAGQERDVFTGWQIQPCGTFRAARRGLPWDGFSHAHLISFRINSINAHPSQDSQSDLQLGDITNYSKRCDIYTESRFSPKVKLVLHCCLRICQVKHVGSVQNRQRGLCWTVRLSITHFQANIDSNSDQK